MLLKFKVHILLISLALAQDCSRTTFKNSKIKLNNTEILVTGCITPQRLARLGVTYDSTTRNELYIEGNRLANINEGAVANFTGDLSIDFRNNIINGVRSRAFKDLPRTYYIMFSNCQLSTMESDVFVDLPGLLYVIIKYNKLQTLQPNTFNNLPALQSVNLEFNQLEFVKGEWFKNTPNLTRLSLGHNLIRTLPRGLLDGLSKLEQLDLKDNQIQTMYEGAFRGLPTLMYLDLTENNFTYVSENVLRDVEESIVQVRLYGNPLQCACYDKLVQWSYDNNVDDPFRNPRLGCIEENPVCVSDENSTGCIENDDEDLTQELNKLFYETFTKRDCVR